MADNIWIDPSSHWKATVRLQADGNFTAITVDDTNGITRGRDLTFSSMQDFLEWVETSQGKTPAFEGRPDPPLLG